MKIVTQHMLIAVPSRAYDWSAWVEGEEESCPVGRGATEVAALRDLCEQLATLYYEGKTT